MIHGVLGFRLRRRRDTILRSPRLLTDWDNVYA
jgi:hypothetical protein